MTFQHAVYEGLLSWVTIAFFMGCIVALASLQSEAKGIWHVLANDTGEYVADVEYLDGQDQPPTITRYTEDIREAMICTYREAVLLCTADPMENLCPVKSNAQN